MATAVTSSNQLRDLMRREKERRRLIEQRKAQGDAEYGNLPTENFLDHPSKPKRRRLSTEGQNDGGEPLTAEEHMTDQSQAPLTSILKKGVSTKTSLKSVVFAEESNQVYTFEVEAKSLNTRESNYWNCWIFEEDIATLDQDNATCDDAYPSNKQENITLSLFEKRSPVDESAAVQVIERTPGQGLPSEMESVSNEQQSLYTKFLKEVLNGSIVTHEESLATMESYVSDMTKDLKIANHATVQILERLRVLKAAAPPKEDSVKDNDRIDTDDSTKKVLSPEFGLVDESFETDLQSEQLWRTKTFRS